MINSLFKYALNSAVENFTRDKNKEKEPYDNITERPPIQSPQPGVTSDEDSPYANSPVIPDAAFKQDAAYKNFGDELAQAPNASQGGLPPNIQDLVKQSIMSRQAQPPQASAPMPQSQAVKAAIQAKFQPKKPLFGAPAIQPDSQTPPQPPQDQPQGRMPGSDDSDIMAQYNDQQGNLDRYRAALNQSNGIINNGQAWSYATRGPADPISSDALYSNMNNQNNVLGKSYDSSADRTSQMVQMIKNRQLQQQQAQAGFANQKSIADERNKTALKTAEIRGQNVQNNRDKSNILATNTLFKDPVIRQQESKVSAASGVKSLIDSVKSGHIKGSKNISNQITNLLVTIEQGSPGGQEDRKKAGVDTLYGYLKGLAGYVGSTPTETIPDEYLQQLATEANALGERAAISYKNQTDSVLAQAGDGEIFNKGKNRQSIFLKQNGYEHILNGPRSSSEAVPSPSPSNPKVSNKRVNAGGKDYLLGTDGNSLYNLDGSEAQ